MCWRVSTYFLLTFLCSYLIYYYCYYFLQKLSFFIHSCSVSKKKNVYWISIINVFPLTHEHPAFSSSATLTMLHLLYFTLLLPRISFKAARCMFYATSLCSPLQTLSNVFRKASKYFPVASCRSLLPENYCTPNSLFVASS